MEAFEIQFKPIIIRDGPSKKVRRKQFLMKKDNVWKLPIDFSGQLQDPGGEGNLWHLFNDAFAARYNLPRRTWRKGDVFFYISELHVIFFTETKPSWSWGEIFAGRHFTIESVHFNHHKRSVDVENWGKYMNDILGYQRAWITQTRTDCDCEFLLSHRELNVESKRKCVLSTFFSK